ncbi:MAG TPA: DUF2889 domain-containing protein [Methylomirabilota bacterium]|nr:DUF2889 domain-containing protein [Methylomirabilota bacterium]
MTARAPAPHPLPVHVRTIRVEALEAAPGRDGAGLSLHGVLEDRRPRGVPEGLQHAGDVIHHMEVTLTVAWPSLVVTAIEGTMGTFPYPGVCPAALPPLQTLVGVAVSRGFTRAVNERIGRERGCTHVAALIQAMGPVVRQAAGAAFGFVAAGGRGPTPWFINSCQAWREGGPLHRALLAAEAPAAD